MGDFGASLSKKALRWTDKRLRGVYHQAEREITEKLADFNRKFEEKSKELLKQVDDGLITKQDYAAWASIKVFQQKQWKDKLEQVQKILFDHDRESVKIIKDKQLDVFAGNYNFLARKTERLTNISFNMVDSHTVARLIAKEPRLLPMWKVSEEKEYKWSAKKAQNAITQGIIQGESVPDITKRLAEQLCSDANSRMEMFARTAVTGAENAGRMEMLHDAKEMGIKVHKVWQATYDDRTRDSHMELDGEEVEVDEEFSNGLMYPGDPSGDPSEVYNCRCTLRYIYPDFE